MLTKKRKIYGVMAVLIAIAWCGMISTTAVTAEEEWIKAGYVLTAQDEFNETFLDEDLWFKWYMPHWTLRERCEANYELVDGKIELLITPEMQPWDPEHDNETVISGIQTAEKDELHQWTNYPDINHHEPTVNNHLQKYGYYEIRAKIAKGGGLHSAWWMIGFQQDAPLWEQSIQTAEVDIFEALGRNGTTNLKYNLIRWGDKSLTSSNVLYERPVGFDMSEDFHVYGFDWDETSMRLYIDGQLFAAYDQSVQYPMLTLLGLYEKRHLTGWSGPFDGAVPYPKKFIIDYWRAYQREDMIHRQNEAEFGKLGGTAASEWRVGTSGTKAVRWLGNGEQNDLEFTNLYVSQTGLYDLYIHYLSGEDRDLSVQVNQAAPIQIQGLNSGSWYRTASHKLQVPLQAGDNTIRLFNPTTAAPDIDRIVVNNAANLAPTATATATSATLLRPVGQSNDLDMNKTYQSTDWYRLPEYITYNWATPQQVSAVKLYNQYSQKQAIVNFEIEVLAQGSSDWVSVATSGDINWQYDDNRLESQMLSFPAQTDVVGLRLKVNKVNHHWNHFAVSEIEIF